MKNHRNKQNYRFRTCTFRDRYNLKGGVRQGCFLSLIPNYLIRYIHFHSSYIMSYKYAKFKENPCVGTDHRSLKFDPSISPIASKPKAHNVITSSSFISLNICCNTKTTAFRPSLMSKTGFLYDWWAQGFYPHSWEPKQMFAKRRPDGFWTR